MKNEHKKFIQVQMENIYKISDKKRKIKLNRNVNKKVNLKPKI